MRAKQITAWSTKALSPFGQRNKALAQVFGHPVAMRCTPPTEILALDFNVLALLFLSLFTTQVFTGARVQVRGSSIWCASFCS